MIETVEKIGGHPGLTVYRTDRGIMHRITEETLAGESPENAELLRRTNREGLHNQAAILHALSGSGYAAELVEEGEDYIIEEDLGESEAPTDMMEFRFHAIRLLLALRDARVRHGDLTNVNIILRDNKPMAVDFAQSLRYFENKVDKRPASDSWWLWTFVLGRPEMWGERDPSRAIRRWVAIQEALGCKEWCPPAGCCDGKMLLDLGCFQGEMCAMAAADGFQTLGIDYGGFRPGEDSIAIAEDRWGRWCAFRKANIMDVEDFRYDVVLLLSTWAYIVQNHGREAATALLQRILAQCGVLFFETQLYGDGPGPEFLKTDADVASLLSNLGECRSIVSLPVGGRDATRTVWQVQGKGEL